MSAVDIARPLTIRWEGYAVRLSNDWAKAYQDIVGVWTVAYGFTGATIRDGTYMTRAQANAELDIRLQAIQAAVIKASPMLAGMPDALAAVIDFSYNLGTGAYLASTLRRKINAGQTDAAASEFGKWVIAGGRRVPGLVARRAEERALFLTGQQPTPAVPAIAQPTLPQPAAVSPAPQPDSIFSSLFARFLRWLSDRFK